MLVVSNKLWLPFYKKFVCLSIITEECGNEQAQDISLHKNSKWPG